MKQKQLVETRNPPSKLIKKENSPLKPTSNK